MAKPEFIKMHCTNTDNDLCDKCPRDFFMPVHSIATVTKNGNERAIIQTMDHAFFHPLCGGQARSIKTSMTYDDVVSLLDGKVEDFGDVEMTYYKDTVNGN